MVVNNKVGVILVESDEEAEEEQTEEDKEVEKIIKRGRRQRERF